MTAPASTASTRSTGTRHAPRSRMNAATLQLETGRGRPAGRTTDEGMTRRARDEEGNGTNGRRRGRSGAARTARRGRRQSAGRRPRSRRVCPPQYCWAQAGSCAAIVSTVSPPGRCLATRRTGTRHAPSFSNETPPHNTALTNLTCTRTTCSKRLESDRIRHVPGVRCSGVPREAGRDAPGNREDRVGICFGRARRRSWILACRRPGQVMWAGRREESRSRCHRAESWTRCGTRSARSRASSLPYSAPIEAIAGNVPPAVGRGRTKTVKAVGGRKRTMSDEQRRAVAERMRKYWASRREAKAQEEEAQE